MVLLVLNPGLVCESGVPSQTGVGLDHLAAEVHVSRVFPRRVYPVSHSKLTSRPTSNTSPVRWPLSGVPGSPQERTAGKTIIIAV